MPPCRPSDIHPCRICGKRICIGELCVGCKYGTRENERSRLRMPDAYEIITMHRAELLNWGLRLHYACGH